MHIILCYSGQQKKKKNEPPYEILLDFFVPVWSTPTIEQEIPKRVKHTYNKNI
jgi:hypothetical protein